MSEAAAEAHVPLKQLSQLSGLSPILIRAWERRYGFPAAPRRTAGGHRRYTLGEVEMVRHAALLVRSGLRASDAIARARTGQALPAGAGALSSAQLAGLLLDEDPARALDYLRGATVATGFEATLEEMVVPALQAVGQGWEAGRNSVADEHVATGVVMSWLGSVRAELPPMDAAEPAYVIANPEGEEHAVPVWALEVLLRMRRVPVRALGASVPIADLVQEARRPGLRGLVLAISRRSLRRQVGRVAAAVGALEGSRARIFTGGAGAVPPLAPGVILLPRTLTETADRLAAELSDLAQ